MEVGKCIECGEKIGGERHELLQNNQHTGDFDGSKFAAWSNEANIQNMLQNQQL